MTRQHTSFGTQRIASAASLLAVLLLEVMLLIAALGMTLGVGFDASAHPIPAGAAVELPRPAPAAIR